MRRGCHARAPPLRHPRRRAGRALARGEGGSRPRAGARARGRRGRARVVARPLRRGRRRRAGAHLRRGRRAACRDVLAFDLAAALYRRALDGAPIRAAARRPRPCPRARRAHRRGGTRVRRSGSRSGASGGLGPLPSRRGASLARRRGRRRHRRDPRPARSLGSLVPETRRAPLPPSRSRARLGLRGLEFVERASGREAARS